MINRRAQPSPARAGSRAAHFAGALLTLLGLALTLACSAGSGGEAAPAEVVVMQSDGQKLALAQPPRRIVSLSAAATETLCAIGAGDSLVAVDKYANCPAGSKAKPEIDAFQPSLEAVQAMRPDLVYVFSDQGNIVSSLRRAGIAVLFLEPPDALDGVFAQIEILGRVTGREQEAAGLVQRLRERRDAVARKVAPAANGPRFFHELSNDYFTVRNDTFIGSLYVLLKGENIAGGAPSAYPQLSSEAIVARDPEVIVLADGEAAAAVKQRPGWSSLSAVRNNRICEIDGSLLSQPGPRIIDGLEALARCFYPGS